MARPETRHLSLRVDAPTVDDLDRLAVQTGLSRNALAARYLAEGIRRHEFPEITFRDGALGRRAALAGSRLDVWQVVETVRAHANSVDEAAVQRAVHLARRFFPSRTSACGGAKS